MAAPVPKPSNLEGIDVPGAGPLSSPGGPALAAASTPGLTSL
jgi:hypothetical protein